jgi:hypothetical protein
LELLEISVSEGLVDIVPALVHDLSLEIVGLFRFEAAISVVFVIRNNFFDLHAINKSIAVSLWAEANDPVSDLRRSSDHGFAVGKCTVTPKRVGGESCIMCDDVGI